MKADYCKLYIRSSLCLSQVYRILTKILNSKITGRTIKTSILIVDVFENKNFCFEAENFVFWPFYLEIEAIDGVNEEDFIASIQTLIDNIKTKIYGCGCEL